MSRSGARLGLSLLMLSGALLGCDEEPSSTPPTQIIVVIDAEAGVRAVTSELAMVVRSRDDDASVYNETLRIEDSSLEWPYVLALTPKDDDAEREFELTVTARNEDGAFVAQVRAITHFVKSEKRTLLLMLEDACIDVRGCGDEETCREGSCTSALVDPSTLPIYDADAIPDPVVVGPRERDAGKDAGTPPPTTTPDDAGQDAEVPTDGAVRDAEVDPGCRPNPDVEDEVCTQICPETCNGEDDDCDRKLDEDEAQEDCEDLPHALGSCSKGKCVVTQCQNGYKNCDMDAVTGCESGPDDVNNCGSCLNPCGFPNMEASCVDNECVPGACLALYDDCDDNGESCETPLTSLTDCRGCMVACEDVPNAEPSCETGTCGPGTCLGNYGDCNHTPGDGCEQALDTIEHCGGCDAPCDFPGSTEECGSGSCLATSCVGAYGDCDLDPSNGCENLSSDAHCGECDKTCDGALMHVLSASCDAGICVPVCDEDAGFGDCDEDPFNGCEAPIHTELRCDCDTLCEPLNAVGSCVTGECEMVRCNDGWDDCDTDPTDCEQSLDDPEHCGGCDNDCTVTGEQYCSGGMCSATDCGAGTADCDDTGSCNYDLTSNAAHCGACDRACVFTNPPMAHAGAAPVCTSSACVPVCETGWGDCNSEYLDGCETDLRTPTDCGACGDGCSIANADETCESGECEVASCSGGWDDCDEDELSCETPLDTTADCGACDADCDLDNAVPTCASSGAGFSCEIAACTQAYYQDCDLTDATGCEADTRSDTEHCGSCSNDCDDDPHVDETSCQIGSCVIEDCDTGYDDCGGEPGCETALGASPNCGRCGEDCSALAHTTATSCTSYECAITTCQSGWASCDDEDSTGCETSVFNVANCGGCASEDDNQPCTNLPNVSASSCGAGTCVIDSCAPGWVSCDGDVANGCEQSLTTVGPCFPDTNCQKHVYDERNYFMCTTLRAWPGAIDRCNDLVGGTLVRIDSAEENAFVAALLTPTTPAWIGATDVAVADEWNWIDDLGNPTLFWKGGPGGELQPGMFESWANNEPNGPGNCGGMLSSGVWGDEPCTTFHAYVCEVLEDLCPSDDDKTFPGQCGCGVPDDDGDDDGTADCNDACPTDPNKVAPGVCDCGVPDTDGDGDGTPDCNDECPTDPSKTERGECGCLVEDADTDGDGIADCNDGCPYVEGPGPAPCRYPYTPSNFDPGSIDFDAPDVVLDCLAQVVIDTDDPVTYPKWCGDEPRAFPVVQLDGFEAVVIAVRSLYIGPDTVLRVRGSRPVILAVAGDAMLDGSIDARTIGDVALGAGSLETCKGGDGDAGNDASLLTQGGGGGGGAGYGSHGANGGSGAGSVGSGGGGANNGADDLVPLRGGCPGGRGGGGSGGGTVLGGSGGGGGGAVQLAVAGRLRIADTSIISASGGGGAIGDSASDGGGGGGSGGAVLIEAALVEMAEEAFITANGGGGASGTNTLGGGNPGTDGYPANGARAPGGLGNAGGGNGGLGSAAAGMATPGTAGSVRGGGGGGGGGVGRVRVNGLYDCVLRATFSPEPATTCP